MIEINLDSYIYISKFASIEANEMLQYQYFFQYITQHKAASVYVSLQEPICKINFSEEGSAPISV